MTKPPAARRLCAQRAQSPGTREVIVASVQDALRSAPGQVTR